MKRFESLEEFQTLMGEIAKLSFEDDRVEFDTTFEKKLTIRFNNSEPRKVVDDEGIERTVDQCLVIENFSGFEILVPHEGAHFLTSVQPADDGKFEFATSDATWLIELDGEFQGFFGEVVDETDFEVQFSLKTLLVTAACICGAIAGLFWFFS